MSNEEKSTQELTEDYIAQAMPASSQIVYNPPTGHEVENDPHYGTPGCYPCCGAHCAVELLALIVVVLVCCAYGTDGTCCDYCYWPF